MKNVHPVYGAGIQTHNLWNMSLLPWPLDQGSRPSFQKLAQYSYIGPNPGWDIWGVFGSGDWKFACPLPRVHIDYRTKLEGFEATYLQTAAATFWATFGNIWATFISTSGHTLTDYRLRYCRCVQFWSWPVESFATLSVSWDLNSCWCFCL